MTTRGRALKRMIGKRERDEAPDVVVIQTWMRIGLERISAIEAQAEGLKQFANEISGDENLPSDLDREALIDAGRATLIDREQSQLLVNGGKALRACIGAKIKATSCVGIMMGATPRFYDGAEDHVLGYGDSVTGRISGFSLLKNGWIEGGAIELIEASSSVQSEYGMDRIVSLHHIFSNQNANGMLMPTVSLELVS